jgi:ABC-type transporter Mla subunit MlaD
MEANMGGFIPLGVSDTKQFALYALGAITILYVVFRPMLRARKKDPLEKLPSLNLSTQRTVEREMQNLLVEMSAMARQITAQLDTRSAKLQALIDEADRKIQQIKQADAGNVRPTATEDDIPIFSPPPDSQPPLEPAADSAADRYAEIHSLADQGRSPREIAQVLDRPVGEVELILALRR